MEVHKGMQFHTAMKCPGMYCHKVPTNNIKKHISKSTKINDKIKELQ